MTQVSYIVAVDNQLPYLDAMLASLRAQEGDHSREYVFVDDGSEDGSFQALIEKTRLWPRTMLIQQRRQGPTAAALAGARAATGDAWMFLDGDVVLSPAATRLAYAALKRGDADLLLYPHAVAETGGFAFADPEEPPEARVADDPLHALLTEFPAPFRRIAMRRGVFREPGFFDPAVYLPDVAPPLNAALTHKVGMLDIPLAVGRADAPSTLRRAHGQAEHDRSVAVADFIAAHPELSRRLRKAALRVAARRSWEAARMARGGGLTSRFLWLYIKTLFGVPMDVSAALKESLGAWDDDAIRRPQSKG